MKENIEHPQNRSTYIECNNAKITITRSRWEIIITVVEENGKIHKYVVSADSISPIKTVFGLAP